MKRKSILLALTAAFLPPLFATGADGSLSHARLSGLAFDVIPACRLPMGVATYSAQKDLPVPLREAVKQNLGTLMPPGSPFDSTDVVTTGHNRRLIFIWTRGTRWVIATEHGGRGYNDPIFAYEVDSNHQSAKLLAERIAFPGSVCAVAEELLSQASSTPPAGAK
jgi:hypothetical protein